MCDPIDTTKVGPCNALQNALLEAMSAMSALNMSPEPIKPKCRGCGQEWPCNQDTGVEHHRPGFSLSEVDGWAAHSVEHLHAVFRLCQMAHHDMESLKTQVFRLSVQLKDNGMTPCVKTWLDEPVPGVDDIE
jgi:hypothetical protein